MAASGKRAAVLDTLRLSKRARFNIDEVDGADAYNNSNTATPSTAFADERESVADTLATSRTSSARPKRYICDFEGCDKAFDRPVRLQDHQRTHTNDRPYACKEPNCSKAFFKSDHLKAHVHNKHSTDASYVCTYLVSIGEDGDHFECGKSFTTSTRLRRHVATHETKEQLKCQEPGCNREFRKIDTLQRHIKQDHLHEKAFRCSHTLLDAELGTSEECALEFSTAAQLRAHENREHAGLRHFCEICIAVSASGNTLESETDISNLDQIGFRTYAELQSHIKSAHPPQCEICGKACESKRALVAHMDIEHSSLTDRQKYPCTFPGCDRVFTRTGNLKVHLQNVHAKRKEFVCGQFDMAHNEKCPNWDGSGCGMAFGTKANLENHVRTQHLGLPTLLKRRARIKQEHVDASGVPALSADLDESFHNATIGTSALSMLTGYGYTEARPIHCWNANCPVRFVRNYDLAQHMELKHGWLVDDINDRLAEDEALSGGQFWIGGGDDVDVTQLTDKTSQSMFFGNQALVEQNSSGQGSTLLETHHLRQPSTAKEQEVHHNMKFSTPVLSEIHEFDEDGNFMELDPALRLSLDFET